MDRRKVYPDAEIREEDLLWTNRFALIGQGRLAQAMLGAGPLVDGMEATPGAGLTVSIAPGVIWETKQIDATAYSSLAPDTHTILKPGFLVDALTLAVTAPATPGQRVSHLIEARLIEEDTDAEVIPYYNSADPTEAYNGPNDDNSSQTVTRRTRAQVQVKAGTPALAGQNAVPAATAGWTGIWVVTLNQGAVSVLASNIALRVGAPFLVYNVRQISAPANALAFRNGQIQ